MKAKHRNQATTGCGKGEAPDNLRNIDAHFDVSGVEFFGAVCIP